jgi:hypothetical protein
MAALPDESATTPPQTNYKKVYRNIHLQITSRLKWIKANPFFLPGTLGNAHEKIQTKLANCSTVRVIEMPPTDMVWCYVGLGLLQTVFGQLRKGGGRAFLYFNSAERLSTFQAFVTKHMTSMWLVWHICPPKTSEWQTITVVIECHRKDLVFAQLQLPTHMMHTVIEIYDHISERQMYFIERGLHGTNAVYLVPDATAVPSWCRVFRELEREYKYYLYSDDDSDDSDSDEEETTQLAKSGCTLC